MIPVTTEAPKRRSKGKAIGAVVGVAALVAAGTFAVVSITGNDEAGGASSPGEVGTLLTTALDNEHLLGVIDLLPPGARDTFRDPLIRTVDNLKRLEVLSEDAALDDVAGFDIRFTDVTVREEATNVDDIVNIFLSGSASATVDGNEVPIGDLLLDEAFDGERPEIPESEQADPSEFTDVPMTVVERDGRWYLSAFYSAAEQARGDQQIPEQGLAPAGADEPEQAIDIMLDSIQELDLERLIAGLDPTEAEALQRYAPLFIDDAQSALDEVDLDFTIGDREYTVEGSGDRRTVAIDALSFAFTDPEGGGSISATYRDGCTTVSFDGDETQTCGQGGLDEIADQLDLDPDDPVRDVFDTLSSAFDDYDPSGISVHEVDGSWYLSPIATMFDAFNDVVDALDRAEITELIHAIEALDTGDYIDDIPGIIEDSGIGVDDGDLFPDDATVDTIDPTDATVDTVTEDTASADTAPDDTSDAGASDAIDECYALDAAAGVQCVQDGIAAGTIDPGQVVVTVPYPECGAAEPYWSEVYSMEDAEFVALAEQVSPCFLDLVASGEISKYEMHSELIDPTCLEGKNWYTNFESDYNSRFYDCVDAALETL
ncbi:MAG: hypothetical protein HZB15_15250 [Actinobacteria bacterium]|nr:hypothetical protein [Actinomycetota bacterium]